jgi:hypothetical protein
LGGYSNGIFENELDFEKRLGMRIIENKVNAPASCTVVVWV